MIGDVEPEIRMGINFDLEEIELPILTPEQEAEKKANLEALVERMKNYNPRDAEWETQGILTGLSRSVYEDLQDQLKANSPNYEHPYNSMMDVSTVILHKIVNLKNEIVLVRDGKAVTTYQYNGKYYVCLEGDDVIYRCVAVITQYWAERADAHCRHKAADSRSDKEWNEWMGIGKRWRGLANVTSVAALTTDIRKKMTIDTGDIEFNGQRHLLNLNNGVYDLTKHVLLPHDKKYRFTKIVPTNYLEGASAPMFRAAIENMFAGDKETVGWLRQYCGSALLSSRREEMMAFINGPGGTGKSSVFTAINRMLGLGDTGFGCIADSKSLESKRTINATQPELSRGIGKLFYLVDDTDKNGKLDEGMLKNLANQLYVNLRDLYQSGSENRWTATVLFLTNRVPRLDTDDGGMDRRLYILPATGRVTEDMRRAFAATGYSDKMAIYLSDAEGSGILNWLLEGLKEYQAAGNSMPPETEAMKTEKMGYKDRTNSIFAFLRSGFIIPEERAVVKPAALYDLYKFWLELEGNDFAMTKGNFLDALDKHGLEVKNHEREIDGKKKTIYGVDGYRIISKSELLDGDRYDAGQLMFYPGPGGFKDSKKLQ